jgi:hypothetical protein
MSNARDRSPRNSSRSSVARHNSDLSEVRSAYETTISSNPILERVASHDELGEQVGVHGRERLGKVTLAGHAPSRAIERDPFTAGSIVRLDFWRRSRCDQREPRRPQAIELRRRSRRRPTRPSPQPMRPPTRDSPPGTDAASARQPVCRQVPQQHVGHERHRRPRSPCRPVAASIRGSGSVSPWGSRPLRFRAAVVEGGLTANR